MIGKELGHYRITERDRSVILTRDTDAGDVFVPDGAFR